MMTSSEETKSRIASQYLLQQDHHDALEKDLSSPTLGLLEDGEESSSEFGALRPQGRPGFWTRLRKSMRRRQHGAARFESARFHGEDEKKKQRFRRRRRYCMIPVILGFVFFFLHILNYFLGYLPILSDDPALSWTLPTQSSTLLDITQNVVPIPCHSHNDYWRRVPLYDALRWGCIGVEADIWLFDNELLVGHSTNALTPSRTFRSMYIDPLVALLDHQNKQTPSTIPQNGIFPIDPQQTLVLLVDFKNDGHDIFPIVSAHLNALRQKGYLTYFNGKETVQGAITVVATGNAPFDLIKSNSTYRDIFFDAPLAQMSPLSRSQGHGQGTIGTSPNSTFDSTNSFYASVNFRRAVGWVWWSLSEKQVEVIRGQVRGAHERGLKARYWSAPKWPIGLRNKIWEILVDEGVDYLNGDDLAGMKMLLG